MTARPLLSIGAMTFVLLLATTPFVRAQDDVGQMALSELHEATTLSVNSRNFAQAIPYLEELISRLQFAEEEAAWKVLDYAMFHLAVARMEGGGYARAIREFDAYATRFPEGVYIKGAHLLWAECYAVQEKWPDVIAVMERFLKNPTLVERERVWGNQLVGEAFFRQEKWEEAIEPLVYVFRRSKEREARNISAVQMTTALVRLKRFEDLFKFIPYVYRTSARFDIALNLALIEAGDENYEAENYPYAISLYRIIFFKQELIDNLTRNIDQAERRRQGVWQEKGLDRSRMVAISRQLRRQIADYKAQRIQVSELPDYDQEVMIRLAQTYLNLQRYWEALTQFRRIFDEYPDHTLAEQALYSAYGTAREMGNEPRALREGYDYLNAFPLGEHWEALTVGLAQIHVDRKEYREAVKLATDAIQAKPDHTLKPNLLYIMGYCHFHLNEMDDALARFREILVQHPASAFVEDASYWTGLTQVFLGRYTEARVTFTDFLAEYPESPYVEDASFRLTVALYGENDHDQAHERLLTFVSTWPGSMLVGEAYCMLGDITASWSQLDTAIEHYARVAEVQANQTEINYALFQSCRIYELESKYDDIIRICRDYIRTYKETGNFSQAVYWIGNAYLRSDRPEEAFDTFFDAIVTYGDVPGHIGIDMIARDIIQDQSDLRDTEIYRRFLKRLYEALAQARESGKKTLYLRLLTLFAETEPEGSNRNRLHVLILREQDLDLCSPLTLLVMGREAAARDRGAESRSAYAKLLEHFSTTDFAFEALWESAEFEFAAQNYAAAETHLIELLIRFPTLPIAGEAQKRLGDVQRLQGNCTVAINTYNTLLGVRDWRGPLFPEALFWIGECKLELNQPREAFAYFQRIYVLYGAHEQWAARAYLKSAQCLVALGESAQAITTLREMLSDETLQELPEAAEAQQTLARLEGEPG